MKKEPKSPYLKGRRLRLFGGPNGSGKSTIIDRIRASFDIGYYINPDEIETQLINNKRIALEDFGLTPNDLQEFNSFIEKHSLTTKALEEGFDIQLKSNHNKIFVHTTGRLSYEAALIADFIRLQLIRKGKKLTIETVMSHPSKIDILTLANLNHYKTYLYFVCTSSPKINIERVKLRVKEGGHKVEEERIVSRYHKTLELLKDAVNNTYRSFIWDNSGKKPEMILEIFKGSEVTFKSPAIPHWADKYLLSKFD